MYILMDKKFSREQEKYRLQACCEECIHFCAKRTTCAMTYPTNKHRKQNLKDVEFNERIYFCKMFEAK